MTFYFKQLDIHKSYGIPDDFGPLLCLDKHKSHGIWLRIGGSFQLYSFQISLCLIFFLL